MPSFYHSDPLIYFLAVFISVYQTLSVFISEFRLFLVKCRDLDPGPQILLKPHLPFTSWQAVLSECQALLHCRGEGPVLPSCNLVEVLVLVEVHPGGRPLERDKFPGVD